MNALSIVLIIALVGSSIAAHEWAHMRVALRNHMRVEEYSIGFGKPILSHVAKSGIRYSIKLIPLGGSVKIAGMSTENEAGTARPRVGSDGIGFMEASPWARLRVIAAGVGMNLLLALIAFTLLAAIFIGTPSAMNLLHAPLAAVLVTGALIGALLSGLAGIFTGSGGLDSVLALPSVMQSGDAAHAATTVSPIGYGLMMLGLLNLSLAFGNALPLYPLDGFHGMVAILDGLRKSRADGKGLAWKPLTLGQQRWPARLTSASLVTLTVFVVGKDLLHFLP